VSRRYFFGEEEGGVYLCVRGGVGGEGRVEKPPLQAPPTAFPWYHSTVL